MAEERRLLVLMADDDEDDRTLVSQAFDHLQLRCGIRFVRDGRELMDYLRHRHAYSDRLHSPRPDLILLDLNMPRMNGFEALSEIRDDDDISLIPVIIFSTAHHEEQIAESYRHGANAFIVKPLTFDRLVDAVDALRRFWFETSELPPRGR